jgi:CubicO group peptidase (beta-lactamase class C family)
MSVAIGGHVETGFAPVADAFRAGFSSDAMGAALCVYQHGRPVIDLWGGLADARCGRPWGADTLSMIFSCTKGLMSILAAQLVAEKRLDYDAPVASFWLEFAAAGKWETRVRHLLDHQAGLSALRASLTLDDLLDWDGMVARLAAEPPLWRPGAGYSYHALTHGWLVGEVIRRITQTPVSEAFRKMIADPLGADAWIGLPSRENSRVTHLEIGETLAAQTAAPRPPDQSEWVDRAITMGDALPLTLVTPEGGFNDPRLWAAAIPAAGGIATARALARIWSAAVWSTDGVRLLDPQIVGQATAEQTSGPPFFAVPPPWPRWGMGFLLDCETRRWLTPAGFGHDGAGGQATFAEPELGIGFAYLTNLMEGAGDARASMVIDALRRVLGIRRAELEGD